MLHPCFIFTCKVRASNLQDLVYKNGQGGITKATVSITFDNSNKNQSPLGFETHDEITVTRQVGERNNKEFLKIFLNVIENTTHKPFRLQGGYWWQKQIPHQWSQRQQHQGSGPILLCWAQCQQPTFPHHAGQFCA